MGVRRALVIIVVAVVAATACGSSTHRASEPRVAASTTTSVRTSPSKIAEPRTRPKPTRACYRPTRAGETLGGIAIYDSTRSVRARLGAALGLGRDGEVAVWRYRGLSVEFATHQGVVRIVADSPGATTDAGVGVGSSGASLVGAYRGHLHSSFIALSGPGRVSAYGFDVTYPNSGFSFQLKDGRIQEVRLNGGCPVQRLSDDARGLA